MYKNPFIFITIVLHSFYSSSSLKTEREKWAQQETRQSDKQASGGVGNTMRRVRLMEVWREGKNCLWFPVCNPVDLLSLIFVLG